MRSDEIIVANLKCNGCAATIKNEILKIEGVKAVEVQKENDLVKITSENVERKLLTDTLFSLGYPEATEKNGLLMQLKSYTSCMIGKMKTN